MPLVLPPVPCHASASVAGITRNTASPCCSAWPLFTGKIAITFSVSSARPRLRVSGACSRLASIRTFIIIIITIIIIIIIIIIIMVNVTIL